MSEQRLTLPDLSAGVDAYEVVQACRLAFLRHFAQALRESGVLSGGEVEAACLGAGRYFDEAITAKRAGFEQADGLTASKISLVGDDQLELEIALGDLARRVGEATGQASRRLYLRFATLLCRPALLPADLPFAPEALGQGLGEMLAAGGKGPAAALALLERVEPLLTERLTLAYGEMDELLARQGVEPAQLLNQAAAGGGASRDSSPRAQISSPSAGAPAGASADPAQALQAAILGRQAAAQVAYAPSGGTAGPTTVIPLELLNQLVARLDALERHEGNDAQPAVATALRPSELGIAPGRPEGAALDAVALIFEAIFADAELPEAVKAAIASLQIPILKTALADPGLFTVQDHPVRRLIDRMAAAACGLPRDTAADHPVCERLQEMAAYVRGNFDGSAALFESSVAKVDWIIARRNEDAEAAAAPWLAVAEAWNRRRSAARRAREALATLAAPDVPGPITDFLLGPWLRYLESLWGEDGSGTDAREALQLANDLVWSVRPKEAPDERRRLAQGVPVLLKGINQGLDAIGVSAEERAPFLDACFALQTAAIRSTPGATAAPEGVDAPLEAPRNLSTEAVRPRVERFEANSLSLCILDLPGRVPGATLLAAPPWQKGDWIDLRLPEGEAVGGGHLSALTPEGWPLFTRPGQDEALLVSPLILDRQLRNGEAQRNNSRSLFATAAAAALGVQSANPG